VRGRGLGAPWTKLDLADRERRRMMIASAPTSSFVDAAGRTWVVRHLPSAAERPATLKP
jgi:hypothetical protein